MEEAKQLKYQELNKEEEPEDGLESSLWALLPAHCVSCSAENVRIYQ